MGQAEHLPWCAVSPAEYAVFLTQSLRHSSGKELQAGNLMTRRFYHV